MQFVILDDADIGDSTFKAWKVLEDGSVEVRTHLKLANIIDICAVEEVDDKVMEAIKKEGAKKSAPVFIESSEEEDDSGGSDGSGSSDAGSESGGSDGDEAEVTPEQQEIAKLKAQLAEHARKELDADKITAAAVTAAVAEERKKTSKKKAAAVSLELFTGGDYGIDDATLFAFTALTMTGDTQKQIKAMPGVYKGSYKLKQLRVEKSNMVILRSRLAQAPVTP